MVSLLDVERKSELGGNIHAKGMMIMQAYLIAELKLEQLFLFSTSVVFGTVLRRSGW